MVRDRRSLVEHLEPRTFLSASIGAATLADAAVAMPAVQVSSNAATGIGITIHARAGVPFTREVAFYPSAVLDPPGVYTATIDWGDGVVSQATLTYGAHGNTPGYEIFGSHVYANPGIFNVTTTLSLSSGTVGGPSDASASTTTLLATISSRAVVIPRPPISPLGVTLTESAGQSFTADVGAVFLPAVQNSVFTATINWGDGTSSAGQLSPAITANASSVAGVTKYEVIGTHTYTQSGTYPVRIVIDESIPTGNGVVAVAIIHSGIIVQSPISLAGTISGTYRLDVYNPIVGIVYGFTGTGTAGDMGAVTATGTITTPGLASATDKATGRITLTNASGSVTLQLTGPTESALGPIPGTMNYKIISASGAFFDDIASGTITITAVPPDGGTPVAISFVIS